MNCVNVLFIYFATSLCSAAIWNPNDLREGKCQEVKLPKGSTKCSLSSFSMSICRFKCDEGHSLSGAREIYCYRGKWYNYEMINRIGLVAESVYKYKTECAKIPPPVPQNQPSAIQARSIGRSNGADYGGDKKQCSKQTCRHSYPGITKAGCKAVGCCWTSESKTCHENFCPGMDLSGFSVEVMESICSFHNCFFDRVTKFCFAALSTPEEPPVKDELQCSEQTCSSAFRGITEEGCASVGCCWSGDKCLENHCLDSYPGMPRSQCESSGCKYDAKTHNCYLEATINNAAPPQSSQITARNFVDLTESKPEECPMLENDDPNMRFKCSFGRDPGSSCTITCDPSSRTTLNGQRFIKCLAGAKWNVDLDEIKNIRCERPQCSAQPCDYTYPGMSKQQCLKERCCWDDVSSSCKAKQCPGSYKGMSERQCRDLECAYNPSNLQCYRATRCAELGEPANGMRRSCSKDNKPNSFCFFHCPPGMIQKGATDIMCQINTGVWRNLRESDPPRCEAKSCPSLLPTDDHVTVTCDRGSDVFSTCKFFCKSDLYDLVGEEELRCGTDGKWTGNYPTCQLRCHLSVNLKTGEHAFGPVQPLVKVVGDVISGFPNDKACNKKTVTEANFIMMKNFKLDLSYPEHSSSFHLTIVNDRGEIVAVAINNQLSFGLGSKPLDIFGEKKIVSLNFVRDRSILVYSVAPMTGDASPYTGVAMLPALGRSSRLLVYTNRYTIANPLFSGSGLCNVCVSYKV